MNFAQTKTAAVLRAIRHGCRTSTEVAEATGMKVSNCSSLLGSLARQGRIVRTDRKVGWGRWASIVYEPKGSRE